MYQWLFLALAAAAGVAMAVQGSLNGALGKTVGVWKGVFLVHAIGLAVVAVLLFVCGLGKGDLSKIGEAPWYLYLGGVVNVLIIFGVMSAVAKLGAGNATTAIIVGQLAMAMLVDRFGWFGLAQAPFTWSRGAGLLLMGLAAKLLLA
ncbi:MAG: DMT family transporter [Firmicutes bacterium]|nr:DMT family transporter [Bacillota bacterium]